MEIIYDETIGDLEIIRKKNMYPAAQKEVLLKNFNEVFKDDTEMLETFESTEGEFEKIYLGLRQNLMKRTIYKFKLDKDKFIDDCIFGINDKLKFMRAKNEYKVETGKAKFNDSQMFVMEEAHYGEQELEIEISSDPKSDFEIVNYIMYHTMLPRLAIFKILQGGREA